MRETVIRWTFYMGALLVVGPLAGAITASVRAPDGGADATALVSASPGVGLLTVLAAVALAGAFGAACAFFSGVRPGMITCGLVLCWATWRTGTVDQILRSAGNGAPLVRLAVEGAVLAPAALLVGLLICMATRPEPEKDGRRPALTSAASLARLREGLLEGKTTALALGAGAAAFAGLTWLIAIEPLKGQAVAAAAAGACGAAVVSKLACSRVSPALPLAAAALLMILGPLTPAVMGQVDTPAKMLDTLYRGGLFTLANLTPLDWMAGAFLGIPIGLGWVGTTEKHLAAT